MPEKLTLIPTTIVRSALTDYERMVEARRAISTTDPVADTMEYIVRDLTERVQRAEWASEPITPEAYAVLPHVRVSAQTVRRWCRDGELPGAVLTDRGWMIPRSALRAQKSA